MRVIDYLLSGIYFFIFCLLLGIFHPLQIIVYRLLGRSAQQTVVNWLNAGLVYGWIILGILPRYREHAPLPKNRPLLLVANHQSMFDIPGIIWFMRHYRPVFVSKKELAKGVPSISYNLRVSGAALIDRNDGKQAIKEIIRLGRMAVDENLSVAIFPEGTRSRTGMLKPFAVGGIATLIKTMKDPLIVPVAIENMARFNPKGLFPYRAFTPLRWNTLEPFESAGLSGEEVTTRCEQQIKTFLGQA